MLPLVSYNPLEEKDVLIIVLQTVILILKKTVVKFPNHPWSASALQRLHIFM